MSKLLDRIHGIVPPLVTPLSTPDSVDEKGLRRLIRHVVDAGVHGVFVLGTTGEFPSLSQEMKDTVVKVTVDEVAGTVPVYVGIGDPNFRQVIKNAEFVEKAGGDVAVILPPFYFPLGHDELVKYYHKLADDIALPIMLYNNPSLTKVTLSQELIRDVSHNSKIIGLKDSQGDMTYLQSLLQYFKDNKGFRIFVGVETLIAEAILFHADGAIPGGANVAPNLFVELYNAARSKDFKKIDRLQTQIIRLNAIYRHGRFWSSYLKGLKTSLSLMGICSDTLTETFDPFHKEIIDTIRSEMKEIGLL